MDSILLQLKELGLTEKQARVYVALMEIGKGTAYAVAKRSRLKRPTTYVILDELRRKGLALKVPHAKNQIFIAKDPAEFFAEQEEKLKNAKRVLPELLARLGGGKEKARAYFFEGKDGIKEALFYGLEKLGGTELLCFFAKSEKGVSQMYLDRDKEFIDRKVRIRALAPRHPSLNVFRRNDQADGRRIILLPESEFSPTTSVEISDWFVRIFLHKDAQALIIESADFASMMKQTFELSWKGRSSKA